MLMFFKYSCFYLSFLYSIFCSFSSLPGNGMYEELVPADVLPARELKYVNVFLGILAFSTSLSSVAVSLTSSSPGCSVCKELVPTDVLPTRELKYLDIF